MVAYVSIKKAKDEDARLAGLAAVRADFAKVAVILDDDIDVCNEHEALWALATRLQASHIVGPEATWTTLDTFPAGDGPGNLSPRDTKLVLDATKPLGKPFMTRVVPPAELLNGPDLKDHLA